MGCRVIIVAMINNVNLHNHNFIRKPLFGKHLDLLPHPSQTNVIIISFPLPLGRATHRSRRSLSYAVGRGARGLGSRLDICVDDAHTEAFRLKNGAASWTERVGMWRTSGWGWSHR